VDLVLPPLLRSQTCSHVLLLNASSITRCSNNDNIQLCSYSYITHTHSVPPVLSHSFAAAQCNDAAAADQVKFLAASSSFSPLPLPCCL
jgi:hypothetical protein